jgi:hypothetical protein
MSRATRPPPACIECGEPPALVTGAALYPHRPDLHERAYWLCACGAYVGCHRGTTRALGAPAGPATRQARQEAHRLFDPLWSRKAKKPGETIATARAAAYRWLGEQMGLTPEQTHISLFTQAQAKQVTALCTPYHRRRTTT